MIRFVNNILIKNMANLSVGDKAPDFNGMDQNGNPLKLSDFKGQKCILFFYPKDNTPGCTAEACNLRDNYALLQKKGFKIIGISADSAKSHQNFILKYQLPFPLVADTEKHILNLYGAWGLKKLYGKESEGTLRTTFVVDENGIIIHIFRKVDTKNHAEQILTELNIK